MAAHPPSSTRASPTARSKDSVFRALIRSIGLLRRIMEPHFAVFGITGAQWGILHTLWRADDREGGLRIGDLGDRLLIRPPSVTGVVQRLRRMGLVDDAASPADQRVKLVMLTHTGRQLVQRVAKHHATQVSHMLECFNAVERSQLEHLLNRLGTHLEKMVDAGPAAAATEE